MFQSISCVLDFPNISRFNVLYGLHTILSFQQLGMPSQWPALMHLRWNICGRCLVCDRNLVWRISSTQLHGYRIYTGRDPPHVRPSPWLDLEAFISQSRNGFTFPDNKINIRKVTVCSFRWGVLNQPSQKSMFSNMIWVIISVTI